MNERIQELAEQCYHRYSEHNINLEKFAELILTECDKINRRQALELTGVIIDVQEGNGFDSVCLDTIKRVEQYLGGNELKKHFGFK